MAYTKNVCCLSGMSLLEWDVVCTGIGLSSTAHAPHHENLPSPLSGMSCTRSHEFRTAQAHIPNGPGMQTGVTPTSSGCLCALTQVYLNACLPLIYCNFLVLSRGIRAKQHLVEHDTGCDRLQPGNYANQQRTA